MTRAKRWIALVLVAFAGTAGAQEPSSPGGGVEPASGIRHRHPPRVYAYPAYPDCPPVAPGTPGMPPGVTPDPMTPPGVPPPDLSGLTTPFATQTGAGGLQGRSFNESFDGDFGGIFYCKTVVVGTRTETRQTGTREVTRIIIIDGQPFPVQVTVPVFQSFQVPRTVQAFVPVPGRYSGVSITDNDSPRPTDRLYFNYSYYDGFGASLSPDIGRISQSRPVMGFEKTFLGGDASIGLRLPFVQITGPLGAAGNSVGDLSVLTKYAFVNNPNGNVVSAGLVLTVPTAADGGVLKDGSEIPHSVLFQPWVGFVGVLERAYVQGVSAVIVPSDARDITLLSNSLGVGYWLYRADGDRFITGVIPVAEVHVRTPLNHRDRSGLVFMQDMVNVTGGLHVRFPRATLGGAVSVPTIGPRPWNVEAIANFTFRF